MRNYQLFFLGFIVFLTGLFAGQMFHEMIGAQWALQPLDDHTYIVYWQSLDKLMHVRMPYASNFVLLVFMVNLIVLWRHRPNLAYWLLIISFLLLVAETVVTVTLQLPVNARIQALDPMHLSGDIVASLKSAMLQHFIIRAILRFSSFILLIIGVFQILTKRLKNQLVNTN